MAERERETSVVVTWSLDALSFSAARIQHIYIPRNETSPGDAIRSIRWDLGAAPMPDINEAQKHCFPICGYGPFQQHREVYSKDPAGEWFDEFFKFLVEGFRKARELGGGYDVKKIVVVGDAMAEEEKRALLWWSIVVVLNSLQEAGVELFWDEGMGWYVGSRGAAELAGRWRDGFRV